MFSSLNVHRLIYIDIETVPMVRNFSDLPEKMAALWKNKILKKDPEFEATPENLDEHWKENAALYPEFGKIVSIVIGAYNRDGHLKTFCMGWALGGEKEILEKFNETLNHTAFSSKKLIAHNGKGFDYPWLIKRCIYNGINPHPQLRIFNKKPWEMEIYDSAEIWKFGAYGGTQAASLDTMATSFGLPSPKEEMSGKHVWKFFYNEDGSVNMDGVKKVDKYCTNDVISMAQVIAKMTFSDEQDGFTMPQFVE